jgi:hypothetical protein
VFCNIFAFHYLTVANAVRKSSELWAMKYCCRNEQRGLNTYMLPILYLVGLCVQSGVIVCQYTALGT